MTAAPGRLASISRDADRLLDPAPFPDAPPGFVVRLAFALRRTLLRLADAVLPADVVVLERALGAIDVFAMGLCAELGVSDLLEQAGPLSADAIASRLGTHTGNTHRLLRTLASRGVYTLSDDGRFTNNSVSRALLSGRPSRMRDWVLYMTSRSNIAAWSGLGHALRHGRSPFATAHGMSVWDWFESHPDEREHFAHAMMGITFFDAPVIASLYPFGEIATLCDVGGGRGSLLSEILIRHPKLRGMLCDAPGVLDSARSLLSSRGVLDRVELRPTNFFESVPAGADAYLLKNILHDWDDARCLTILANVRRAMDAHSRLIVVEALCPPNDTDGPAPLADLQMMAVCDGGRERSREDFDRLFERAGFRTARVFPYPTTSVLEARPG